MYVRELRHVISISYNNCVTGGFGEFGEFPASFVGLRLVNILG